MFCILRLNWSAAQTKDNEMGRTFNMHEETQNLLHFARKSLGERNISARLRHRLKRHSETQCAKRKSRLRVFSLPLQTDVGAYLFNTHYYYLHICSNELFINICNLLFCHVIHTQNPWIYQKDEK